jgi:PAS domain S-box-containing protein
MQHLADLLEAQRDVLLKQWIARVDAALAPGGRTAVELTDHLPEFLQHLIESLRGPARPSNSSPTDGQSEAGRLHGAQRFRVGFELESVVREYGVLLHLVLDLVEEEGASVASREVRRLNDLVTNAVAEAVTEYARRHAASAAAAMEREVSEAAQARREAERLKAQLETMLLSIGDGVLATDAAGRITLLNPAAEQLTGWRADEALGQPAEAVIRLLDAATRAALPSPFAPVLRGEPPAHLDDHILLVRRDGGTIAFADSLTAIRDGAGAIVGAVLVFRDDTEVRRKDAELRVFRAVVEASTDFISFGRPGGRPEYLNPAGLRMVGLDSVEAATALDVGDYYMPESRDAMLAQLIPLVRAGQTFQGQTVLRHFKTSEPIPVSQAAFSVNDEAGRPMVLAAVLRDRREQQLAESERERLLADAQAARREADLQREHLTMAFSQAPVAVGILRGDDDVVVLANDAICRIWGHTHAELIQRPIFELLVDAKREGFPALLAQVRRTGEPFVGREVPVSLPRHDGAGIETVLLNFVYQPLRAADGSISDILAVATDVTAEVQARRSAEAISAEFEAMFNSMPDAAYFGDATGIKRANPAGLALLGVDGFDLLRCSLEEMALRLAIRAPTGGDGLTQGRSSMARALAGEIVREEYVFRDLTQGRDIRVRTVASPVRVGGVITGAVVLNTDITEQHRALEALHRSEASFRTLAEAIPQQVWTARPDGGLDFVNQRVLAYFGATEEEILGAGWLAVLHPDDVTQSGERWMRSLATGEEYEVEFRLRRADGAYRWHLGRARASRNPAGEIVKWFGTNTDIDEANKAREELEKRTTFEQHLLGIVSHDLRNPLAAIVLSATSLLQMRDQSERVTKLARRIHSSAERSTRMIGDLLDFTQARLGGGIRLERRPADLYALASTMLDEVEAAYPERTLDLTRAGDTRGTWDADRILQVMTNLVTNALKYSPAGTPVAVRAEGHNGAVELAIHNECPPIPPELLGRIFEPLQRATDQIDRKTRSVGLGLYIVNAIVRAHGGTVAVVSTADAGTTFTVRLPREPGARLSR